MLFGRRNYNQKIKERNTNTVNQGLSVAFFYSFPLVFITIQNSLLASGLLFKNMLPPQPLCHWVTSFNPDVYILKYEYTHGYIPEILLHEIDRIHY